MEEVIRGFQCTLASGLDFYSYRTRDQSEVDLIIEGRFGLLPIEIKLGHKIHKQSLKGLKHFMNDTGSSLGILINNADKMAYVDDNTLQIPAGYW